MSSDRYRIGEGGPLDPLVGLLSRIGEVLDAAEEPQWARRLSQLAASAGSGAPSERRFFVSEVLALFGGTGSFSDIVLQDERGVLPQHEEFDRLRSELFDVARGQLR